MKTHFWKAATAMALLCALAVSLTGCDSLDYREAIRYYNAREYEKAAQIFSALGDFEESARLEQRCRYWQAVEAMEEAQYQTAITRLQALNGYEDADARITECKYQLAKEYLTDEDLDNSQTLFQEVSDYKNAQEYLRQIRWQRLFDAVNQAGDTLRTERDGKSFSVTAHTAEPNCLVFFVSEEKDMGYRFYDDLTLTLTRDSLAAEFTATSTFSLDLQDGQIGSRQEGSGRLGLAACTPETVPVLERFSKTVTDHHGNTTASENPEDSRMDDVLAENFSALMTVVPEILADAEIPWTLADLGFACRQ